MRRTGLSLASAAVAGLLAVLLLLIAPLASHQSTAEASQTSFPSAGTSFEIFSFYEDLALHAFADTPTMQGSPLRAQALDDIARFEDASGDSSLAEDLAAMTIAYDPSIGAYSLMIEFHDPFIGLISEDRIGVPIDSDQNASTGYSWGSLGIGSDYGIIIESSDDGCSTELFKTPTSNGAGWTLVASLENTIDTAENSISFMLPGAYIGSPPSFNVFVCSTWEALYTAFYDFMPDSGYQVCTPTIVAGESTDPEVPGFSDVVASDPYSHEIAGLASKGIVNGFPDGTFRPDDLVTSQQFAKMIVRTLQLPVSESDLCPFEDVPSNVSEVDPLYPDNYVAVCAREGITIGKTPTSFGPYDNITRAQLITMVSRALQLPDPPLDYVPPFNEYDTTHYPLSRKASYAGLLDGLRGIGPGYDFYAPATRGEVCLLLFSALK